MKKEKDKPVMNVPEGQLSPEQLAQLDAYTDNATLIIYGEKTQESILQELQSGSHPIESVALTANHVHRLLADGLAKTGEQMTDQTIFLGGTHVVSELINLGETAGLFEMSNAERMDALQYTIQLYFEEGLKNGTIDPVALQKEIEPLLTPEQRQYGLSMVNSSGVSKTPPPSGAIGGRSLSEAPQGGLVTGGQAPQPAPPSGGQAPPPGLVAQGGR